MLRNTCAGIIFVLGLSVSGVGHASGPLAIDHRVNRDDGGIWNSAIQDGLVIAAGGAVAAGALWEGGDTRLGHTLWQSVDAMVLSIAATETLKFGLRRESPAATDDPGRFFESGGDYSFPSAHVAVLSSAITPILLEYRDDHPYLWAMEGLVAYEMVGRVKAREHWQSDVLTGAVIGTGLGWYAHDRGQPLILGFLPHGFFVGLKKRF